MPTITVSAALLTDARGRLLVVRKAGTHRFMQPGGKPEPGESPLDATRREVVEEVGLDLPAPRWRSLGVFQDQAANEPGHALVAHTFAAELTDSEVDRVTIGAEIAEARWVTPTEAAELDLAPLTRFRLLPLLR